MSLLDITFCSNMNCKNMECERNQKHFKETSCEFILEKKDMYDMNWEEENE